MKTFTGWEALLIDVANNAWNKLDKEIFETRIQWATDNLKDLETLAAGLEWKKKPLYLKAVQAVRTAQRGEPTGHLVGFDAVCSGMQIMSALTGCEAGAKATGLINTGVRPDAYTECARLMNLELGYTIADERDKVKQAVMTSLYGSKKEPKTLFGEDTPELAAFYKAMLTMAPGACELLEVLLQSWQAYDKSHNWKMPDGFDVHIKVMQRVEKRIEVDELNHSSFTYVYYENDGERRGVKNAANIIHSVDAYILRSLLRRCNYNEEQVRYLIGSIDDPLSQASVAYYQSMGVINVVSDELAYHKEQFNRSGVVDLAILPYLRRSDLPGMGQQYVTKLREILSSMVAFKPFEVVTVHDDFRVHPNNVNALRMHYREILAELAESDLLGDILSQIHGVVGNYTKLSTDLGKKIRSSEYALC